MKRQLKITAVIVAFSLGLSAIVYGACYRAAGGSEVIVSQIPEGGCPPEGTGCQVMACSVRWETTDEYCVLVDPSNTYGKTQCDTNQTEPKLWIRRFGNCANSAGNCYCAPSGITDHGKVAGETVKRATLSGSDCGQCPV